MKSILFLFILFISQNIFSQQGKIAPYEYKTPKGKIVVVQIDTTKYKPNGYKGFLYKLYNEKTDASVFINEKKVNFNDTVKEFEKAKKEFEFTDLGLVNGERTITLKSVRNDKDKRYVNFLYLKFIQPNEVLNFIVSIPENNFEAYKEEFIRYAKSMTLKP